jgi:hypothetical protein
VTPEQAVRLLSVEEWPPRLEHWPPKDKHTWRKGMTLVGKIEAVLTLPRPEGSKKRGEPYTALYVRRESDKHLVMFHGWHTAAEDLDGMHPAPGLLFACVYRGERDNGFEDFKYLVSPYGQPAAPQQGTAKRNTRQDGGQPTEASPARAPDRGEPSPSPRSGSTTSPIPLAAIRTVRMAQAAVRGQPDDWKALFQRISAEARDAGELNDLPELDGFKLLIERTDKRYHARGEAA